MVDVRVPEARDQLRNRVEVDLGHVAVFARSAAVDSARPGDHMDDDVNGQCNEPLQRIGVVYRCLLVLLAHEHVALGRQGT